MQRAPPVMRCTRGPVAGVGLGLPRLPAQVCTPTTQVERQFRTAMKLRPPGFAGGAATSVAQLAAWPTPADVADPGVRSRDAAIDPRERQAFVLEGDL